MKTNGTPGPWVIGGIFMPYSQNPRCNIYGKTPPGCQSGDLVAENIRPDDAIMIVATHDLLDAAIDLIKMLDFEKHAERPHIEAMRAAIAKAKGTTA